jgi:hypothetical protein
MDEKDYRNEYTHHKLLFYYSYYLNYPMVNVTGGGVSVEKGQGQKVFIIMAPLCPSYHYTYHPMQFNQKHPPSVEDAEWSKRI